MFQTFVLSLFMWRLIGVFGDEVKSVSVMERQSVTLNTDTELQTDDLILWWFGPEGALIAEINRKDNKITIHDDDDLDGRFRDRLQVDHQTGSLTITNISTQHTGLYQMIIRGTRGALYTFNLTVYTRLPVPVIIRDSSSSVSSCVFVCSVLNMAHVTLSWYNGSDLHSSISVSDLNIRLSLPLEVEYQDTNTYSCVLNNPITNHTTHLCRCSDCFNSCASTEAVMRLVVSALMGVAAVAALVVLVYDIRSRRAEQNRRS